MDPLSILRTFVVSKELDRVVERDSEIDFGGRFCFAKSTPTAYKSEEGKGPFYDLQSVLFFARTFEKPDVSFQGYFKEAKERGLMSVRALDRKDLEGYLTGKKDTSAAIRLEESMLETHDESEARGKRPRVDEQTTAAAIPTTGSEMAPSEGATAEQNALRGIMINERQLRDRNSMLSVPGRTFQRVLEVLQGVMKEEAARRAAEKRKQREDEKKQDAAEKERAAKQVVGPRPSGRYERETAPDAALKQIGAQNLGLQLVGYAGTAVMNQRPPPPPSGSSKTAAQPTHQPKPRPHPRPGQPAKSGAEATGGSQGQHKQVLRPPIIMVPPAATALINILNIKEFLETGTFRTPEQAAAAGAKKPDQSYISMMRTAGRKAPGIKYHITDKEPQKEEDWNRVVAVFCLGKAWQFRRFPFAGAESGDLVDTFQKVFGVYVHYGDEPVDPQVKKWNVKLLKIGRHNRDGDPEAFRDFWTTLDAFLAAKKSNLTY